MKWDFKIVVLLVEWSSFQGGLKAGFYCTLNKTCYTWVLWHVDAHGIMCLRHGQRVLELCPFFKILILSLFHVTKQSKMVHLKWSMIARVWIKNLNTRSQIHL